ncbi:Preprotein translocase subunit SecG (TC 3.A.5.1.1) [Helicobacter bizzozeronii CCUG 35545]|nr:Preprotein translocase subunit SecG (TC 3.A.5.1.1) [Helicobacter bizzozeronii CCUG 35545]
MSGLFLVLQIILAVIIVVVVLLQKSSSIGLGAYSGSNESLFGAKGPASFLAKLTMFLGFLFLANTIVLGYFYNKEYNISVLDSTPKNSPLKAAPLVPQNPTNNPLNPLGDNPLFPQQTPNPLAPQAPINPESTPTLTNPQKTPQK